MFSIEKEIERLKTECEKNINLVKKCEGIEQYISFVDNKDIYIKDVKTFENVKEILHKCCDRYGQYTIGNYYPHRGGLCINYKFKDVDIVFYCCDVEHALGIVSNNKCRIAEKTFVAKTIVCDIN